MSRGGRGLYGLAAHGGGIGVGAGRQGLELWERERPGAGREVPVGGEAGQHYLRTFGNGGDAYDGTGTTGKAGFVKFEY